MVSSLLGVLYSPTPSHRLRTPPNTNCSKPGTIIHVEDSTNSIISYQNHFHATPHNQQDSKLPTIGIPALASLAKGGPDSSFP